MNFQQSYLYWLAGAVLLIVALMSWQDKANPRRFTIGLFWGIYGVLFLLGDCGHTRCLATNARCILPLALRWSCWP